MNFFVSTADENTQSHGCWVISSSMLPCPSHAVLAVCKMHKTPHMKHSAIFSTAPNFQAHWQETSRAPWHTRAQDRRLDSRLFLIFFPFGKRNRTRSPSFLSIIRATPPNTSDSFWIVMLYRQRLCDQRIAISYIRSVHCNLVLTIFASSGLGRKGMWLDRSKLSSPPQKLFSQLQKQEEEKRQQFAAKMFGLETNRLKPLRVAPVIPQVCIPHLGHFSVLSFL